MAKQRQEGGDHSVNVQGETINVHQGLSLDEARKIALDVFRANFEKLAGEARDVAFNRAEEITERFLRELEKRNPVGLQAANDPDMQFALLTAQREYARSGREDLATTLVDLLVDRTRQSGGSLQQIVLNESISVVPKLTTRQLAVLSVVFFLRYTRYLQMTSLSALVHYIELRLAPFVNQLPTHVVAYQHLEYAGCGTIGIGTIGIVGVFLSTYPGLFNKGFTEEELTTALGEFPAQLGLLTECLHDPARLQINAVDEEGFREAAAKAGLGSEQQDKLLRVEAQHRMDEGEVRTLLLESHPAMAELLEIWEDSLIKNLTLTSVGLAIGHANAVRVTGDRPELSIWIPSEGPARV